MNTGLLLIDKPTGITSAKALNEIKKRFSIPKMGHAGTLDPDATGLLICLIGRATKLASYAEGGEKTYTGHISFGVETTTGDAQGEAVATSQSIPAFKLIAEAAGNFTGQIEQMPPLVSALKVNGKRAYDLARQGIDFSLKARKVEIKEFRLSENESKNNFSFFVRCSKGTYIRSLAHDLGRSLGCGAHLSSLRREGSSPFSVKQAASLQELTPDCLQPWSSLFPQAPKFELAAQNFRAFNEGDFHLLSDILSSFANTSTVLVFAKKSSQSVPVGIVASKVERVVIDNEFLCLH
jgi:tRNA pseudouridine55 synthase